jgi:hypothetical protein
MNSFLRRLICGFANEREVPRYWTLVAIMRGEACERWKKVEEVREQRNTSAVKTRTRSEIAGRNTGTVVEEREEKD